MKHNLLIYDWTNGVVMIAVFALVCIIVIGVLVSLMTSKKNNSDIQDN